MAELRGLHPLYSKDRRSSLTVGDLIDVADALTGYIDEKLAVALEGVTSSITCSREVIDPSTINSTEDNKWYGSPDSPVQIFRESRASDDSEDTDDADDAEESEEDDEGDEEDEEAEGEADEDVEEAPVPVAPDDSEPLPSLTPPPLEVPEGPPTEDEDGNPPPDLTRPGPDEKPDDWGDESPPGLLEITEPDVVSID